MSTQLVDPEAQFKISPEALEVAQVYLRTMSVSETALELRLEEQDIAEHINKKEVKKFIDTIFLEQGYQNKFKLQGIMDGVITQKLEEMQESEMGSSKDIADLIALQHKMRMDELKAMKEIAELESPQSQINVQNNYGENYSSLLQQLMGHKEEKII